jgi:hypothetical protein
MPPTRQIEHGQADLDHGMARRQGFLGGRLDMTVT